MAYIGTLVIQITKRGKFDLLSLSISVCLLKVRMVFCCQSYGHRQPSVKKTMFELRTFGVSLLLITVLTVVSITLQRIKRKVNQLCFLANKILENVILWRWVFDKFIKISNIKNNKFEINVYAHGAVTLLTWSLLNFHFSLVAEEKPSKYILAINKKKNLNSWGYISNLWKRDFQKS